MDGEGQFFAPGFLYLINLQVDIFSHQLLLIPIHLGVHWATVVIDFTAKEMVYYDSKPNKITTVAHHHVYTTCGILYVKIL